MKQRLLVMNGQRIVQAEQEGAWVNQKVDKAGLLKPGIYNLYLAQPADKAKKHDGVIVYADNDHIYQQLGKAAFVTHPRSAFQAVPDTGKAVGVSYDSQGHAQVATEVPQLTRGRSR